MNTENGTLGGNIGKRQCDVAYAMVRSGKPVEEILAQYAVTEEEFTEWVRDGRFSEYAASLARGFAEADAPYVWTSLLNTAKSGNIPAIKLYFEIWNKRHGADAVQIPEELSAVRDEIFGGGE
ncbi:MAG: hypothetical protein IJ497_03085 [Clostridia bacterium]|nr:hypothetical protein [Clostridia bacterium]MBQ8511575.1 hypothetical protein [Clostridia bacterium]